MKQRNKRNITKLISTITAVFISYVALCASGCIILDLYNNDESDTLNCLSDNQKIKCRKNTEIWNKKADKEAKKGSKTIFIDI